MGDLEPFEFSINWGNAWWESLIWIAEAWAIAAVATLIVLFLIAKLTSWGRQFWRVTRGYFTGPGSARVWLWLAVILLIVMAGVRLDVLFSYQSNDMYSSVQLAVQGLAAGNQAVADSGIHGFWVSLAGLFSLLATLHVLRVMLDLFLAQRFMLDWRAWLTDQLTDDWLEGRAYYRARFIDDSIDNPDQRIQSDIDIFTTGVGPQPNTPNYTAESTLLFGAITSIASVIAFTQILWNLAGDLTLFGVTFPRAVFWTAFIYVLVASVIAFWIGRPIIRLAFDNEKYNAAFRYALVRLRDASESVAFYRGEVAERHQLRNRFDPVLANYKRYINRMMGFTGWNLSMSQIIVPLPWLIQAPRLFAGEIKFGDVTQTASAFGSIQTGLSFFRNAYDSFAGWRAAIIRLHGLVVANEQSRALPTLTVVAGEDDSVCFDGIEVLTPAGDPLISRLNMTLTPGDALVITGRSGAGKTTLLRALAQLWPFTSGAMIAPGGEHDTLFMSQLPYVPLGDLRAVVSYPQEPGDIADELLADTLVRVALPQLAERLSEIADWAKVLSPGEQQRIAFARLLLTRPKVAFMDEATSALDGGLEYMLYDMVRTELPETILVSVSHRDTVEQHHRQQLRILGGGAWELDDIDAAAER
ncbi:ABC transporter ATP-binding protein/permease [Mycolicibacterium fallax]|uniref:Multidrug ABC transporter ATP-binding protein n=1 Tax=Mycolicibacterium fallax TaxID=1793 RepID=A0A1X1RG44_MYCFA|nr:ABC transporter ATP-binding protein/permease [Mycolicibacterium fallax]ORV04778.1 multidrug ABC transporter ATP-binding protein [Mycolicibacterium fallax]BBY97624.1 ABC transporter permease [Mycolicibacterium fallax]HOW94742.1 ABC transporter ATP-binding protein/permease [Mycolicibacterium fallax]